MKSTPILFSGPMVRAIIEGRKTQTRRVVKVQPPHMACEWPDGQPELTRWFQADEDGDVIDGPELRCPYGGPGDRLWVRETWGPCDGGIMYRASESGPAKPDDGRWHPSILMPRWASRLLLEIVSVRVERLQSISEDDAVAEGLRVRDRATVPGDDRSACVNCGRHRAYHLGTVHACPGVSGGSVFSTWTYRGGFAALWDSLNGKRAPWSSSPWVWVIEFRKVEQAAAQRSAEQ